MKEKKTVILLHGFLSDCDDFAPLMDVLEEKYDHIEKACYPGHGEDENYWDFDSDETLKVIDEIFSKVQKKYEIIDVIGYSLGGALGVYLSNKYQFNKLVLLAPGNKYFNFLIPYSTLKYLFFNLVKLESAVIKKQTEEKNQYIDKLSNVYEDDLESFRFVQEKYLKPYFLKAYQNFKKLIRYCNEGITEIKNPCFIAWGELDQIIPKRSVTYLYDMCTNEEKVLKIYKDLTHMMLRSADNQKLLKDIIDFLN